MQIREMRPEEHLEYRGMCKFVYHGSQREDIRGMMENPLEHQIKSDSKYWGCFGEDGRMHSAMIVNPFTIRMNGRDVKMGGIGGVITLPEYRGKAHVRRIFDTIFPTMIDAGQVFSCLYPFSYAYYRKFGYDLCYTYNECRIPINQLSGLPFPKHIEAHWPGDDISPYAQVYETFVRDRNLSMVRSQKNWDDLLKRDPYQHLEFTYLCRDESGNGISYIMYRSEEDGRRNTLEIKEFCWSSVEGFMQMLGFMAKLSPEFKAIGWRAPHDLYVNAIFPDAQSVKLKAMPRVMNRVVDVIAGLETLAAPGGSGQVTIDVTDTYWQSNSGAYTIAWEGGHLTASKTQGKVPDMSVSVGTLAQLITGYLTPSKAVYKPDTRVHSAHAGLDALFPKKKIYLMEFF